MAKTTSAAVSELDGSPSHLLHRVLQLALDIYTVEAGATALTQRQYAVLAAVAANEGASQTWLVRATGIDRSTLADLVARMIAKGYLARERSSEDARANTVKLAEAGREALAGAGPRVEAADARILSLLGHKKREPFVAALRRLARAGEDGAPSGTTAEETEKSRRRKAKKKAKKAKRRAIALHAAEPTDPLDGHERPSGEEGDEPSHG